MLGKQQEDHTILITQHPTNTCGPRVSFAEGYSLSLAFGLALWMISPFAILWSIWKRKNDRIFRALSLSVEEMEHLVFLRIAKWVSCWKEFDAMRVEVMLRNWETSLLCAAPTVSKRVVWDPPSMGALKFNVGGAARGK